ncbi:hypothetical protein FACS189476_05030 [Spirochaetia bacterium]|nr:hypothetical protein FACS189476_05030 [Spirochaetia bacterium]
MHTWPAEVAGTYWVSGEGLSARIVKFNADNTFFDNDMNGGKIDNTYTVENFRVSNTNPNEPWYYFDAKPVDANIWGRDCAYYIDSDGKLHLSNEVFDSDRRAARKGGFAVAAYAL